MRSILIALTLSLSSLGAFTAHSSPSAPAAETSRAQARAELAKQRALNLERLRVYREAGQFAADKDGRPVSLFRDDAGRLCPMAYLIAASKRMDLVDHVVRTNNGLQLADVTEGPLWDWMLTSGLTREEIVTIQGAPRMGFELGLPRERAAPIMVRVQRPNGNAQVAQLPTVDRMRGEVVRRLAKFERQFAMNNDVSLAVAESRLPQTKAVVRAR